MKKKVVLNILDKLENEFAIQIDKLRIAMIKHTQQNYAEWKKEIESDVIVELKEEIEKLKFFNRSIVYEA